MLLQSYLRELHSDHSEGPWMLVHIFAKDGRHISYDMNQQLIELSIIINVVLFAETSIHWTYCDLVVATFYVSLLCNKLHEFTFHYDVNSILSTSAYMNIYNFSHAKRKALLDFLKTVIKTIHFTWSSGLVICYQKIIKLNGLSRRLERMILNYELKVNSLYIFFWGTNLLTESRIQIPKCKSSIYEMLYSLAWALLMTISLLSL